MGRGRRKGRGSNPPPSFLALFCPSRPFSLPFAHPSVIRTPPVILSEAKNLAFRLYGHDAGGVRQRVESKPFFPSPRPSPSRGEGGRGERETGL